MWAACYFLLVGFGPHALDEGFTFASPVISGQGIDNGGRVSTSAIIERKRESFTLFCDVVFGVARFENEISWPSSCGQALRCPASEPIPARYPH